MAPKINAAEVWRWQGPTWHIKWRLAPEREPLLTPCACTILSGSHYFGKLQILEAGQPSVVRIKLSLTFWH